MRVVISSALALALGPFGCPSEPEPKKAQEADEPVAAATPEASETPDPAPQPPTQPPPQPSTPQKLDADVAQSEVDFAVARATVGHLGHFEKFSATLELADGRPQKLEIAVKTGSVVTDAQGLTSHLKSADFFDVDQFPTATFSTKTITPAEGDEPNTYEVVGTMHLHGVHNELSFPATIVVEPDRVTGRATLDISAKAFEIEYEGMEAELAEDSVALEINLVFPR